MIKGNCSLYDHNASRAIGNIFLSKAENGNILGIIFVLKVLLHVDNKVAWSSSHSLTLTFIIWNGLLGFAIYSRGVFNVGTRGVAAPE